MAIATTVFAEAKPFSRREGVLFSLDFSVI
jgi:hypothetical protein